MKVNIIKPGKWAEDGKFVHNLFEGEQEIKTSFALQLIKLGAAKEIKEKKVTPVEIIPEKLESEPIPEPEIESEPSTRTNNKKKGK